MPEHFHPIFKAWSDILEANNEKENEFQKQKKVQSHNIKEIRKTG